MKIIKCKAVLFTRLVTIMAIFVAGVAAVLFLFVPVLKGYIYFLSMVLSFSLLVYIFYLNRFELLTIGVEPGKVHLSFINNTFFKRKDLVAGNEQVRKVLDGDKLIIFVAGKQEAIVRKKAVEANDWEYLNSAECVNASNVLKKRRIKQEIMVDLTNTGLF